jgi:hypothetical protein
MRPELDELVAADPEPRVYQVVEALALSRP